ncbi:MAG: RAMP superfamily CRISPR-associated protein [Bacillota bacterium]
MPTLLQSRPEYGGFRQVHAFWVVQADLVLTSAALIVGTQDFNTTDMAVLRDPKEGRPLLPGTSLAGALRSYLADFLRGYGSNEPSEVAMLFGSGAQDGEQTSPQQASIGAEAEELGHQSPLIVFDSLGIIPEGLGIEIRDGVAIDPQLGTAETHKKFDLEVLPPGTVFPIRLEMVVDDPGRESKMLALLNAALSGFAEQQIRLGTRRSRGLGAVRGVRWRARRFDLTSAQGWLSWLLSDTKAPIDDDVKPQPNPQQAFSAAWPEWDQVALALIDRRKKLVVQLELLFPGGLLIRQPGTASGSPDAIHLTSGGQPVISGTSFAGVLRHRALQIARIVRQEQGDAELWVNNLFGPRHESDGRNNGQPRASRVWVSEASIDGGKPMRISRIRIDRFTQGVVKGALFEEEPTCGGTARLRIEVRNPEPGEIGLMLLVIKDLITGDLPIGGTASVGRGVCTGSATVWICGREIALTDSAGIPGEHLAIIDSLISEFHNALRKGGTTAHE